MKRILVTGAGGFIGVPCLQLLLRRGYEVHAISRSGGWPEAGVICHKVDLMDAEAVDAAVGRIRPPHALHLAWETTPGTFWHSPSNKDWIHASEHLLTSFARHGGARFVGAGSCAEYDWAYEKLDENTTPCNAATPYGQAKDFTRKSLAEIANSVGVSFAWGRTFFLYGPGEKRGRLVSDVIVSLLTGSAINTSTGTHVRDYMHVADVAAAFVALMDSDVEGAVNIASGEARPIKDVLQAIEEATGRNELIRFGARPSNADEPVRLEPCVKRLFDEVGFRPQFSLTEGIKDTVNWWRGQLKSALA